MTARAGLHDVSLHAATRLLQPLTNEQRVAAPLTILQLAYPTPFSTPALEAAHAESIPPLLVFALVRQESAFNPEAGSSAGAVGLTQVIASTGQDIAAALGIPWDPADAA